MIRITRLDGSTLYVNADHLRSAEANPDTVITFIDGKRMVVRESPEEVVAEVIEYRGRITRWVEREGREG